VTEKRTMFIEVSKVGNTVDGLAIGFSRYGDNGTWCGEEIKLVVVHAEKACLGEISDGLLERGGDFNTGYWHRALIVTENRTLYFESENGNIDNQKIVTSLWSRKAIDNNRNIYVALLGLDPLRNDTHAVAIGIVLAAQFYGTPEAFFRNALKEPKKKSMYERFLDWLD